MDISKPIVSIELYKIEELGCTDNVSNYQVASRDDLSFSFEGETIPDLENNYIIEDLEVKISSKEEKRLLFKCKIRLFFHVKDLASIVTIEEDVTISFKIDIIPDLVSITVGALRGMVAVHTIGTPLSAVPLPLIDPMRLLGR